MEIITYVLAGALEHRDSMGNGSVIRPGDVQRMSAGTGVSHSESNPSDAEQVHLLQIWILPQKHGLAPSYEEKHFAEDERRGRLQLVAGQTLVHPIDEKRSAWLQVARGTLRCNDHELTQGDGAAVREESELRLRSHDQAEVLLFDLA